MTTALLWMVVGLGLTVFWAIVFPWLRRRSGQDDR
ncbi:MAG: hypothetical protein JWN46_1086 [Acidimicrobiales bacterium]|nr:hypothetical protein [Acidimicrobiales bacterium]